MTDAPTLSVRSLEKVLTFYTGALGALFVLSPSVLNSPVYIDWQIMGAEFWGVVMLLTSGLHAAALVLNGHAPRASIPLRLAGCFMHLLIGLIFARYFLDGGAPWGALTMLGFLVPVVYLIVNPIAQQFWAERRGPENVPDR